MKLGNLFLVSALALALTGVVAACGSKNSGQSAVNRAPAPYPSLPGGGGGTTASNKNLAVLMKSYSEAVIQPTPWAGYWFPYQENGIVSAASKYDAANGAAGAASWERSNHGLGLDQIASWWGHCNGWTAAAMLAPEPRAAKSIGGRVFDVSDLKALLSETYMEVTGDYLGNRVDDANDTSSEAFNDVWPAQFFLAITAVMGAQSRSIAVDRYTGVEVWNHPLVAYSTKPVSKSDYLGTDPQFGNLHRVNMATTIYWVSDEVDPDVVTPAFDPSSPAAVFDGRTLRYELWLDAPPEFDAEGNLTSSGDIVLTGSSRGGSAGGVWKNTSLPSVNSHPDYMWIPTGPAPSTGFKNPRVEDNWVLSNSH